MDLLKVGYVLIMCGFLSFGFSRSLNVINDPALPVPYGVGEDYLLWQNGITQTGTNYLSAWSTLLSEISQWHFNTIRLAFSFSDCPVNPATGKHTQSVLDFTKMDSVIAYLYSNGYRVVLDLHNWNDMYQYCGSPLWRSDWEAVAQHYKNDSRIIAYELFNEPYNTASSNPQQTETWYPATISSRADLARQYSNLTDELRLIDPSRTMVWADPQAYLQTVATTLLPTGVIRDNVMFAWHGWVGDASKNTMSATLQIAQNEINRAIWWQQQYPSSKQWLGEFGVFNFMNYTVQQQFCITWLNASVQNGWGFSFWEWYENCGYNNPNTYPAILNASNYHIPVPNPVNPNPSPINPNPVNPNPPPVDNSSPIVPYPVYPNPSSPNASNSNSIPETTPVSVVPEATSVSMLFIFAGVACIVIAKRKQRG